MAFGAKSLARSIPHTFCHCDFSASNSLSNQFNLECREPVSISAVKIRHRIQVSGHIPQYFRIKRWVFVVCWYEFCRPDNQIFFIQKLGCVNARFYVRTSALSQRKRHATARPLSSGVKPPQSVIKGRGKPTTAIMMSVERLEALIDLLIFFFFFFLFNFLLSSKSKMRSCSVPMQRCNVRNGTGSAPPPPSCIHLWLFNHRCFMASDLCCVYHSLIFC